MPLPTGGCASAACRMVHTISSIRALSCLSDSTAGTERQTDRVRAKERERQSQNVSKSQTQSFNGHDFIASPLSADRLTGRMCVCVCVCLLTFLSLHRLFQQKFSHTLPVFQQLLRAFPQGVHQVGCMLMELDTQKDTLSMIKFYKHCVKSYSRNL